MSRIYENGLGKEENIQSTFLYINFGLVEEFWTRQIQSSKERKMLDNAYQKCGLAYIS
jgi:hypothetical protein